MRESRIRGEGPMRERVGKRYKGTQRTRKLSTMNSVELAKWKERFVHSRKRPSLVSRVR